MEFNWEPYLTIKELAELYGVSVEELHEED